MVEVVLVKYNLLDNQFQLKSKVLCTSTPNEFYGYLINVEQSQLVFLKTCNADLDVIIITFTNPNSPPLEIEGQVNLALLINR